MGVKGGKQLTLESRQGELFQPLPLKFLIGEDALFFAMPGARRPVDKERQLKELARVCNNWR